MWGARPEITLGELRNLWASSKTESFLHFSFYFSPRRKKKKLKYKYPCLCSPCPHLKQTHLHCTFNSKLASSNISRTATAHEAAVWWRALSKNSCTQGAGLGPNPLTKPVPQTGLNFVCTMADHGTAGVGYLPPC